MLHRAWLLLAILSVLVQDSDAECTEKNRRNLSGLVGVGYDLLTDTVKEAVYEETLHKRDDLCVTAPAKGVSLRYGHASSCDYSCDYTFQQFVKHAMFGHDKPRLFDEVGVPAAAFSEIYERGREIFQHAEACTAVCIVQKTEFSLEASTVVSSRFKDRVLKIVAALAEGRTDLAKYRAEKLVRDYGTHVIKRAEAWALSVTIGRLTKNLMNVRREEKDMIKEQHIRDVVERYSSKGEYPTWFEESGGQVYKATKGTFSSTTDFGIGRHASRPAELQRVSKIAARVLADNATISQDVSELVDRAINDYFHANTHRGCMRVNATRFDSQANVDNGECLDYTTFGGFYDNSSLSHYNEVRGVYTIWCGSFNTIRVNEAIPGVDALYWCQSSSAADSEGRQRLLFGGFYSDDDPRNPLTYTKKCQHGYRAYTFTNSLPGMTICYDETFKATPQYEISYMKVICGQDHWRHFTCPKQFESVPFTLQYSADPTCELHTCVRRYSLKDRSIRNAYHKLHRLPFFNVTDPDEMAHMVVSGEQNDEDLPIAVIAGSAVAVLLCIIIIIVIAFCIVRRAKSSSSLPGAQPPKESASSTSTGSSSAFNRSKTAPNTARTVQSKTARTVPSNTQATPKKA